MRSIKKFFLWSFLLNRRFLKKPLFLFLLCLIPLTTLLARQIPGESTSLLSVGVCAGQAEDELTARVLAQLTQSDQSSAVRYIRYHNEKQLRQAVFDGDVRLGFLFPKDLSALFSSFAAVPASGTGGALSILGQAFGASDSEAVDKKGMQKNAIRVICGSNDIVTKMEKEQLFGKLYPEIERYVLKAWMDVHADDFSTDKKKRDAWLDRVLSDSTVTGNFFQLSYLNGDLIQDQELNTYYLSLLRGLLAITLILICFAACLFLMQDNQRQLFVWLSPSLRPWLHYLYLLIPVLDGGLFVFIALSVSGVGSGLSELAPFLLYLPAVCGFSNLVRVLTGKMTLLSASIPIVVMGCLFLTPVFFDLQIIPALQAVLPTAFYLRTLHGASTLLPLSLYAAVTSGASILIDWLKNR
ncbi:MAG: hypothetical protein MR488_05050 [Lachnospiraceae bacterium]|nr:hypothetical protein [Lachnospiraceae bacterium]